LPANWIPRQLEIGQGILQAISDPIVLAWCLVGTDRD
jgi:hypothetical protein